MEGADFAAMLRLVKAGDEDTARRVFALATRESYHAGYQAGARLRPREPRPAPPLRLRKRQPLEHLRPGYLTSYDDMEVEAVVARSEEYGVGAQLTRPEKVEVTARLTCAGKSARQIARTLGTSDRSVVRYRNAKENAS